MSVGRSVCCRCKDSGRKETPSKMLTDKNRISFLYNFIRDLASFLSSQTVYIHSISKNLGEDSNVQSDLKCCLLARTQVSLLGLFIFLSMTWRRSNIPSLKMTISSFVHTDAALRASNWKKLNELSKWWQTSVNIDKLWIMHLVIKALNHVHTMLNLELAIRTKKRHIGKNLKKSQKNPTTTNWQTVLAKKVNVYHHIYIFFFLRKTMVCQHLSTAYWSGLNPLRRK